MTFHTGPQLGGLTPERMRIMPNTGLVGIGLTAPQNLLHLNTSDNYSSVYNKYITNLRS